jgi:hypothetical protein
MKEIKSETRREHLRWQWQLARPTLLHYTTHVANEIGEPTTQLLGAAGRRQKARQGYRHSRKGTGTRHQATVNR